MVLLLLVAAAMKVCADTDELVPKKKPLGFRRTILPLAVMVPKIWEGFWSVMLLMVRD